MTRIDEIRQRLEAATRSPWTEGAEMGGHPVEIYAPNGYVVAQAYAQADRALITHAAADIHYLIAELAKAQDDTQAELNFQERLEDMLGLDNTGAIGSGIVDAIQKLLDSHRWIPVGERLPTDADPACLVRNGRAWDRAIYNSREGWMGTRVKGITHWMPVPGWEKEDGKDG